MRYDVPIFDPLSNRGADYYHPGNEEAILLVHVRQTFADIVVLVCMYRRLKDEHERSLVSKYVVMELYSLDTNLRHLANMVIRKQTEFITPDELVARTRGLRDDYARVWRKHAVTFKTVRDKLSAHRDPLALQAVADMWDSIDQAAVEEVLRKAAPLHDVMKDLNIFKWTKTEMTENGEVTAFVQPFDGETLRIPSRNADR